MPNTKSKRSVKSQSSKIQQKHARSFQEEAQLRPSVAKKAAEVDAPQPSKFMAFVKEFPWLTGILSALIVVSLVGVMYNSHLGFFAQTSADPCAWAKNPATFPIPAKITYTYKSAPQQCITTTTPGLYSVTLHTLKSNITFTLDQQYSAASVNSFVFLATHGFYNGLSFFEVKNGMALTGDPNTINPNAKTSTYGQGGPGYNIAASYPKTSSAFTAGAVALMNTGSNKFGSQFFIATQDDSATLQDIYNYIGNVYIGLDVVQKLQAGDIIQSVTVSYNINGVPGLAPSVSPTAAATSAPAASPTATAKP